MKDQNKAVWIGVEHLKNDPAFQQVSNSEFVELPLIEQLSEESALSTESSRRDFLKYLGFGIGAATIAASCEIPVKKAIPYVVKPDTIVPGIATYYASSFVQGGDYCAVLIKTREGRPIKIEGNSPLGYGEKLLANILASDEKMVYGRAGVQVPVGAGGLTVGAGVNHSQYELGDTYKDLDAVGNSDTFEINAKYPLVRTVPFNLYLQGTAEQRKLHDDIRSTQTVTDKQSKVASVSLLADWQDNTFGKQAQSQASVTVTGGKLAIDSEDAAAIDAKGANTTGNYSKVGISLSRQQAIADKLSLTAQVRGQWASKNLDSSEKFSLGGANGVRAYPSGEASGDSGWLASLELRYAVIPQMVVSVFYDAGSVTVNTNPYLTTDNKKSLAGAGIGLSGEYEAFNWRTTLAWRNGDPSTAEPDKKPRFWVQAGWRF